MKTCCFSGHRDIGSDNFAYINAKLYNSIHTAIKDGYINFISGFANGIDIMAANIVLDFKNSAFCDHRLSLEAFIPYRGMLKKQNHEFQFLIKNCDSVNIISEIYYPGCMQKRNLAMIEKSNMLIAVYDGRKHGGTKYTINEAIARGLKVKIIKL